MSGPIGCFPVAGAKAMARGLRPDVESIRPVPLGMRSAAVLPLGRRTKREISQLESEL